LLVLFHCGLLEYFCTENYLNITKLDILMIVGEIEIKRSEAIILIFRFYKILRIRFWFKEIFFYFSNY